MSTFSSNFHTHYETWHPPEDRGVRSYLRSWALDVLSFGCDEGAMDELNQPHIQFLYIHHVFEDEEESFRYIIESLSRHYEFISYSEAVRKISEGTVDRAYMSFSSDDGFFNNLAASRIMDEFGISACFFLNPVTIGVEDPIVIEKFCRERLNARPSRFLNWGNVEDMQRRGHEIGSHSMRHLDLGKMTRNNVAADLGEAKVVLEAHCGLVKHLAFPYGSLNNFSLVALEECVKLGHKSIASAVRGSYLSGSKVDLSRDVILRDQVVMDWPLKHLRFFLKRNLNRPSPRLGRLLR